MAIAGISLSDTDGQVFLRSDPSSERHPLETDHLRALLQEAGYGDWVVDESALAIAVQDCNHKKEPFVVPLAQRLDASIQVVVAPDEMTAAVTLIPPQGGKAANIEDILQALHEAGVTFGIDSAALLEACQAGSVHALPVASGAQAQDGQDADFEEMVPQASNRAPRLDANGLIDYREHSGIALVEPGAPLMHRIPATQGIEGRTIKGAVIVPRPGRDEPFAAQLIGAEIDSADPNILKASVTGQPVRVPCGVMVEPVLRVPEVNLATGNIYFDGTVQVDGDVNNTMKVQASGDIVVGGTVEGAQLDAGGNITIKGGVIAQARVKAGGAITARFCEAASLEAGTVIALDDMALESQLRSGNQILIGTKAPQRGRLVGGTTHTMMLLKVPYLGSTKTGVTQVAVGSNPELEAQYQALQERLAKEKANEDNLQKLSHHLTSIGDPKGMLDRVKASWRQAVQIWGKSLAERTELDKQLARTRSAKLEVGLSTEGMVELAFGSKKLRLRKEYKSGTFSLDAEARIVFTDPSGQAYPAA